MKYKFIYKDNELSSYTILKKLKTIDYNNNSDKNIYEYICIGNYVSTQNLSNDDKEYIRIICRRNDECLCGLYLIKNKFSIEDGQWLMNNNELICNNENIVEFRNVEDLIKAIEMTTPESVYQKKNRLLELKNDIEKIGKMYVEIEDEIEMLEKEIGYNQW